jgi:hypothetical protein
MTKTKLKILRQSLLLVCLWSCISGWAEEDEISPDTLPDELPQVVTETVAPPTTKSEEERSVQSIETTPNTVPENQSENKSKDTTGDAELEKPMTPLFPTEPLELSSKSPRSIQAQIDAELSQPDPSYVAPKPKSLTEIKLEQTKKEKGVPPLLPEPVEAKTAETNKSELEKTQKVVLPALPPDPILTEQVAASPEKQPESSNPYPRKIQRPVFVLAPQILNQMLADSTHLIPVDTFIARLALPPTTPSRPPKGVSDFSIILSNNEFYPSKVILKAGSNIRLLFTTTNRKSSALVIEKLNIQRWVSSEPDNNKKNELDRSKFEVNKELSFNRVTEIEFDPKPGVYGFHDVITGASGEISVEEP